MGNKLEIDMKRVIIMIFVALFTTSATNAQTSGNKRTQKTTTATRPNKPKPQPKPSPNPKPSSISKSKQITTPSPTPPNRGYINGHEWVDLGLSVKWATCNVGASSPSDYGGYYAWGETSTKSRYDLDNCFDFDSTGDSWGTYKIGGQTRITPTSGHDTARENWGGTWRMPTNAENDELCKKCTWIWTSQGGHSGYKITGPNGNSIFLPAADWRIGTGNVGGGNGNYWSSTLSSSRSYYARGLYFYSSDHGTYDNGRGHGLSVRPVTE